MRWAIGANRHVSTCGSPSHQLIARGIASPTRSRPTRLSSPSEQHRAVGKETGENFSPFGTHRFIPARGRKRGVPSEEPVQGHHKEKG